ncbi:MAG: glycosyltransferase family 39 protein [Microthrixaceae bacterium]|nr:glycosyltransferase family 39 protein [Microthrixaceae bacterium]MCO5317081.1 glycosyltransferase family 39 protein [Microthrixaceae bacterium]
MNGAGAAVDEDSTRSGDRRVGQSWYVIGGPVLLAAAVRILYWVTVTPNWRPDSDADQYLRLARNLVAGEGYALVFPELEMHATAFRPPLYPFVLAGPSWLFGPDAIWPARVTSLLLSLGVVALTVVFVRRIAGNLAAVVAGCAVALMPSLLANDTITLSEPLGLLLILAVLIALDSRRPIWAGLAAGALVLTRPNAYLVVLIAAAFIWRYVGWKKALMCLACAAVVVAPWLVRNKVQVGTWSLTTSQGFTLAAIYAPQAQEQATFVDPVFDESYDGSDFRVLQFDEAQWSSELTAHALSGVREDPGYVFNVISSNVRAFLELSGSNNDFAERIDGRNLDFRDATLPLFYAFLLAGMTGIGTRLSDRRMWPAYVVVGQFVLLSLLTVSPPRLRAPFDLLLCIGVGLLVQALDDLRRRRAASLVPSGEPDGQDQLDASDPGRAAVR